jgi:hypothetical protein
VGHAVAVVHDGIIYNSYVVQKYDANLS